jgi:peroxiredoxin
MRRRTLARVALAGSALLGGGCALEARVNHVESQEKDDSAKALKWHKNDDERLNTLQPIVVNADLEVARLERRQKLLEARIAELTERLNAAQVAPPSPKPPAPAKLVTPEVPLVSPVVETAAVSTASTPASPASGEKSDGYLHAGEKWSLEDRQAGAMLAAYYATGDSAAKTKILTAEVIRDVGATGKGASEKDVHELVGHELSRTRFLSSTQATVDVATRKGKKNVVLVVLRGFDGSVCIACSGQTLAISKNLDEFDKRDAEVFLLYPGKAESIPVFLDAVRDLEGGNAQALPVEILLDVDLAVVKEFKIEGKLAKPSTLIMDKKGIVRFAHVGQSKTDRPTVGQMLDALDRIVKDEQGK